MCFLFIYNFQSDRMPHDVETGRQSVPETGPESFLEAGRQQSVSEPGRQNVSKTGQHRVSEHGRHNVSETGRQNISETGRRQSVTEIARLDEYQNSRHSESFLDNKRILQNIADFSLMIANGSQFRAVLEHGGDSKYFIALITLIVLSLVSHTMFVFISLIRPKYELKHNIALYARKKRSKKKTNESEMKTTAAVDKATTYYCCSDKPIWPGPDEDDGDDYMCQCFWCRVDRNLGITCRYLVFVTICSNIGITAMGL